MHLVEPLPRQLEAAGLPKSSALGLLGVPGLTAYLGLMEVTQQGLNRQTNRDKQTNLEAPVLDPPCRWGGPRRGRPL